MPLLVRYGYRVQDLLALPDAHNAAVDLIDNLPAPADKVATMVWPPPTSAFGLSHLTLKGRQQSAR